MKIYGLTGGIASGKSTVTKLLVGLGFIDLVLDWDQVAREVREFPEVQVYLLNRFKTSDRRELRKIVFQDPGARKDLQSIVGPKLLHQVRSRTESARQQGLQRVLWDAALLVESGFHKECDEVLAVEAPVETRLKRLLKRDEYMTESLAQSMIAAQMTDLDRELALLNDCCPVKFLQNDSLESLESLVREWVTMSSLANPQ